MAKSSEAEVDIEKLAGLTSEEAAQIVNGKATTQAPKELDAEAIVKATMAEIAKSLPSYSGVQPPQLQTIVNVQNKFGAMSLRKFRGQTPNIVQQRARRYFSVKKGLSFYVDDNTLLQFLNNSFETDDEGLIKYLETHPRYKVEFWRDKLPEDIVRIREHDKAYYTREKELYR
jgi:hypothetical protein